MRIEFAFDGRSFWADPKTAIDLSSAVDFDGDQPTFFGLPRARQLAVEDGGFVGDTGRGGGCNCRSIILCPHGNGTHTESAQHLRADAPAPAQALREPLIPARLLSITATTLGESGESYSNCGERDDRVISATILKAAASNQALPAAVVLRTQPNDESKRRANYDVLWAPYFTFEAIAWLCESGVKHLIVDLPSLDRHDDEGELANHHRFWSSQGDGATVTELAFIPNHALDGLYLLNLQLPHLLTDAVPSRPLLFPAVEA